jgi:Cu2+-containing amine oxidase
VKCENGTRGAQPTLSIDEQVECEQAVLASEDFKTALKRHYGIADTSLVMVDISSAGNYGSDEDSPRRLLAHYAFFEVILATMGTHGQSKDFDLWLI